MVSWKGSVSIEHFHIGIPRFWEVSYLPGGVKIWSTLIIDFCNGSK